MFGQTKRLVIFPEEPPPVVYFQQFSRGRVENFLIKCNVYILIIIIILIRSKLFKMF